MTSLEARIVELEARQRPADLAALSPLDRDWFCGLSAVAWVETAWQFAALLAERRYWFEVGRAHPWAGDWRQALSSADRDWRVRVEVDRLAALMEAGTVDPIATWLEIAEHEGWPALGGIMFGMDGAGFELMEQRHRRDLDYTRASHQPGAVAWRAAHPGWRPGMTRDEALAFEMELMDGGPRWAG